MNRAELQNVLEVLEECHPHAESYDFGPAYELAKQGHKRAVASVIAEIARNPTGDELVSESLAMMIRMLCSYGNTESMKGKAMSLLRHYGLQGSPLR